MTEALDPKWYEGERGRRVTQDRDRVMTDKEAREYDAYIKPIMRTRATAVIDKFNAIEEALDPDVRLVREKTNANYKYKSKKRRLRI